MNKIIYIIPIIMQAIAILFDEFYFHHKRGLPLFEKIGHPLDSLSSILAIGYVTFATDFNLYIYLTLCIFSALLITKDEWIHHEKAQALEQWLHALLFILHPSVFYCALILREDFQAYSILQTLFFTLILFVIYQCSYWLIFKRGVYENQQ